ncbi:ATP-dependent RNA helicase DDX51-like [Zophobas morio]|uniref:ATP-dependent RNA helicase DDX51-like n=1 Tax=Zophobas morio TaxID=2755281 RepID=UPI0030832E7A
MLLNSQLTTSIHPGDLCVCAPTGSGKTLAYVLPILHHLLQKRMRKLRCLIILPTRDLVQQVYKVVEKYAKGTSLKFTSCTGQTSFEAEQKLLVSFNKVTGAYESLVDIVVATPGRLLDHLGSTRGFTLQYLRFLVLDEADRLFYESYYDWLSKTLKSIYSADEPFREEPVVLTPAFIQIPTLPLQKLVFSATLTPNPQKLSALRLQFPKFITAATYEKFVTPEKLKEYKIVCSTLEKPLVLVYLLQKLNFKNVLCFTSSVESTHRLFLLLKLFGGISVAEYSSLLPQKTKEHVLEAFKCNQIDVLVCSDSMARGMDLENVEKVICFDAPFHMKANFYYCYILLFLLLL